MDEEEDENKTDPNVELNGDTDDVLLHLATDEEKPQEEPEQKETIAVDKADIQTPSASSTVEADTEYGIHTRDQIAVYAFVALSMSIFPNIFLNIDSLSICSLHSLGPPRSRRHLSIRLHQVPIVHIQLLPALWTTHPSTERVRPHS
jgi:hypothetical protein